MGRYAQYVGKIKLENIPGLDKEITPKVGDGRKFLKIIIEAEDNKSKMFDQFAVFITELIIREEETLTKEDREELDLLIDINLLKLLNETMIAFNMTTREEIEKQKKDMLQVAIKEKKI